MTGVQTCALPILAVLTVQAARLAAALAAADSRAAAPAAVGKI